MILQVGSNKIKIVVAQNYWVRLKGLMGVSPIYYGMLFPACNAIHTFFMKEAIDVIGLNEHNQIIYMYRNLPKNQIIHIKEDIKKTSILELPQNTSKDFQMGNILFFEDEDIV